MICFALLAHDKEDVLRSQIDNIRKHNPDALVVLYNGGNDPEYGLRSGVPVCPYSKPLKYGRLERFLLDVASWLEQLDVQYDYLVSMDSDILFVNRGYESFLQENLHDYDFMGVNMAFQSNPRQLPHWSPGQAMWMEWRKWQPFFQLQGFCGTFNPMQVYRRDIMKKILSDLDYAKLEKLLAGTSVRALEEILVPTLAVRAGGKPVKYPSEVARFTLYGKKLTLKQVQEAKSDPSIYFVHPVKRKLDDAAWNWVCNQS